MKKIAKLTLSLISALLCFTAYADFFNTFDNDNNDSTTFLGLILKARYTGVMKENFAFSVLGEASSKNFRLGATIGTQFLANQRIKLSGEWLRQKISYEFFSGSSTQWLNQFAIGLGYQFDLPYECFDPAFDLSSYYSYAPSKSLGSRVSRFTDVTGIVLDAINERRIAGSHAAGIAPGVSFTAWEGSRAGLALNYDFVHYNTKFSSTHKVMGLGGTAYLTQIFDDHFLLGASAAIRRPFNYYAAYVGWRNVSYLGSPWTVGVDAGYTAGKSSLPSTWSVGISFDYLFDSAPLLPFNLKDYKCEAPLPDPCRNPLPMWIADPAVYMPQVLAIADERVTLKPIIPVIPVCPDGTPPVVISTIPLVFINAPSIVNVSAAAAFSGKNLTFSLMSNVSPPNTVTINPVTGVVTITAVTSDEFTVTVTATNACGSISTRFPVLISIIGRR